MGADRKPLGRTLLLSAVAIALAMTARGAAWWRLPLWGAEVRVFALDPFAAGVVYIGTSRGNFYVSSDSGRSWAPARPGPAFPGYYVSGLVADPDTPGRLWATLVGDLGGGLLARSDDRGESWTVLLEERRSVPTRALALGPSAGLEDRIARPRAIAIGGDDGVRLSHDGGRTWSRTGEGVDGLHQVESLAFDPADANVLYAGTWRQAFRTRDGGASWRRIADGMVLDATVYAWDFDGADANDVWVSTCGWVYHSKDGGDRWTRYTTGFTNRRSHAIRRDPTRPGVIYAATVGGLHRSGDGGATWTRVSRESLVVTALEVDRKTGRLYVGTEGEGVFTSDDGGRTLEPGSRGLTEARVPELVADPNDPGRVYFFRAFAGEESGVWETTGRDVHKVSRDALPATASLAAFRGPTGRTVLLVASSTGVRVSKDGGARWSAPEAPPAGAPMGVWGGPFDAPVVVTDEGVFTTADGDRFEPVPGGRRRIEAAELLADASGEPLLELRSGATLSYWDGRAWSTRKKAALGGGIFIQSTGKPAGGWSNLQDVDGTLWWQEGRNRRAFTSPRASLTLASAAASAGGRVYVATMGDGLFLFEP